MTKSTALYIGEKEIKWVKDCLVTYKDWTTQTFTEAQLQYVITKEPKDLSDFRDIVLKAVCNDMLDLLEKHDVKKWDVDAIWTMVIWSYNEAFSYAVGKAFWTFEEWRHVQYFMEDIKISDIKRLKDS